MAIALSLVLFVVFWALMLGQYSAQTEVRLVSVVAAIGLFFFTVWIGEIVASVAMFPLFLISLISKCCKLRWRWFAVATLLPLAFSLWINVPHMAEVTHLLRTTPMEDLRPRLRPRLGTETPLSGIEKSSFSVGSSDQLSESARLENQLIQRATWFESVYIKHGHRDRVLARLAKLHAQSLKIFEETPGFGTSRVREMPIRKSFIELPELTRIPLATQPESRAMNNPLWRHLEDWNFVSKFQDSAALSQEQRWHVLSVANFVNSPGYGYIPHIMGQRYDIEHVWGHQPHGFRFAPALNDWCVVRLDLVSLLLHDPPVVYMSENLPMMAELNAAPTRTLNNFELASLKQLLEGAPLIVAPDNDRLRMMGAIRSGDSCLQCHEVENGRMLGAFSYELVRSPASTR